MTHVGVVLSLALLAGCAGDRSITHGADGEREWNRKLHAAVPLGTPRDSAVATLERNGFRCVAPNQSRESRWCDKWSGGKMAIVRRRWQAVIEFEGERVTTVRASTNLTGP